MSARGRPGLGRRARCPRPCFHRGRRAALRGKTVGRRASYGGSAALRGGGDRRIVAVICRAAALCHMSYPPTCPYLNCVGFVMKLHTRISPLHSSVLHRRSPFSAGRRSGESAVRSPARRRWLWQLASPATAPLPLSNADRIGAATSVVLATGGAAILSLSARSKLAPAAYVYSRSR